MAHRRAQAGVGGALVHAAREAAAAGAPLNLASLAARFEAGAKLRYGGQAARLAYTAYVKACKQHATAPQPVTEAKVVGFLVGECLRGRSSQTLKGTLSALLRHLVDGSGKGPTPAAATASARRRYSRTLHSLEKEFPGEVIRKNVFSDAVLRQILGYLAPFLGRGDLFAHGMWAMLLLNCAVGCRNVHLRGRAFTWSQVTWTALGDGGRTLVLDLPYSKMHRNLRDRQFDAVPVPRRAPQDRDLDAVGAFLRYAAWSGNEVTGTGAASVFPRRNRLNGLPKDAAQQHYDEDDARTDLRWVMAKAGIQHPNQWGLHSMRRTAATRYLSLGVDPYTVMRLCGWKSSLSLRIYDARLGELAEEVSACEAGRKRIPTSTSSPAEHAAMRRGRG